MHENFRREIRREKVRQNGPFYTTVINCLTKNLITHFVWYLEKKKRYGIKTLFIDRVLNKGTFLWKNHAENVHQKLVPDPF